MTTKFLDAKFNSRANGETLHLFHSEVLFIKGMLVTSIYVVVKGSILIFASDGKRILRLVGPHQILGINEVLNGAKWKGIGVAQGHVELVAFSNVSLLSVIDKIPKEHKNLLEELLLSELDGTKQI